MFTFFCTEDLSKKMYYTHHCSFPMIEMLEGEIDSSFSNHHQKIRTLHPLGIWQTWISFDLPQDYMSSCCAPV